MSKVLLDLNRLKGNPSNGLYYFSLLLGKAIAEENKIFDIDFYLSKSKFGIFGNEISYVEQKSIHKYYKFNTSQYDIWHSTTGISWYKPFNKKTKFIFTIHDLNFLIEKEYSETSKKRKLKLIQERVDRADHVSFISNYAKKQAIELLDLNNVKCSVIYNGGNILNLNNKAIPKLVPKSPFLFSIGQFYSRKNFHSLMPLLQNNNMQLVIAGDNNTPYTHEVLKAAKYFNVLDKLILIGLITEEEKIWYLAECEAFVFPSVGEGFGLPPLEAMQFGKPVFLSKEMSLPEIGGDAAYYFDSFEPEIMKENFKIGMEHYLKHKPIEKIKSRAAHFSYNNTAKQFLSLYENILL